jgi:hypothetical protein
MGETDSRAAYDARCAEVAKAAAARGIALKKVAGKHELQVAHGADSVVCPVVTDERDWQQTTPEEAFYAVLLDVKSWHGVKLDDATLGTLDDAEKAEIGELKSDTSSQSAIYGKLAALFGGDAQLGEVLALLPS